MSAGKYTPCERMRRSRDWSQVRLAGIADVGVAVVAAIESGRVAKLKVETLSRVAMALGCSVLDVVPGLAVRRSAGGRVQEGGGHGRSHGRAKRELVKRAVVEVLRERGGSALGADVVAALGERYAVSQHLVVSVRRELGAAGVVEAEQLRGVRPGLGSWEWRLVQADEKTALH